MTESRADKRRRPKRVPMAARNRISFSKQEKGYVYRLINDQDDRIKQAQEAGYEFVQGDDRVGDPTASEASQMDSRVSKPVGGGTTGYLMRIKEEFYAEDQQAKEEEIRKSEEAMDPDKQKEAGNYESKTYGDGLKVDTPLKH